MICLVWFRFCCISLSCFVSVMSRLVSLLLVSFRFVSVSFLVLQSPELIGLLYMVCRSVVRCTCPTGVTSLRNHGLSSDSKVFVIRSVSKLPFKYIKYNACCLL